MEIANWEIRVGREGGMVVSKRDFGGGLRLRMEKIFLDNDKEMPWHVPSERELAELKKWICRFHKFKAKTFNKILSVVDPYRLSTSKSAPFGNLGGRVIDV
jgi:hypothetical protein